MFGDKLKRVSRFQCPVTGETIRMGQYEDDRTFTDCFPYECGMCPPKGHDGNGNKGNGDGIDYSMCALVREKLTVSAR